LRIPAKSRFGLEKKTGITGSKRVRDKRYTLWSADPRREERLFIQEIGVGGGAMTGVGGVGENNRRSVRVGKGKGKGKSPTGLWKGQEGRWTKNLGAGYWCPGMVTLT